MPLRIFAIMDSVMTRLARCVVASPGGASYGVVGALRFADLPGRRKGLSAQENLTLGGACYGLIAGR